MDNLAENLSLGGNIWNLAETDERQAEILCQHCDISTQMAKLLLLRDIKEPEISNF